MYKNPHNSNIYLVNNICNKNTIHKDELDIILVFKYFIIILYFYHVSYVTIKNVL